MKKPFYSKQVTVLILVALVLIIMVGGYQWQQDKNQVVRRCPDAWVFDKMPGTDNRSDEERQYFIFNGSNIPYKNVDVSWVKKNCKVNQPQEVF